MGIFTFSHRYKKLKKNVLIVSKKVSFFHLFYLRAILLTTLTPPTHQ